LHFAAFSVCSAFFLGLCSRDISIQAATVALRVRSQFHPTFLNLELLSIQASEGAQCVCESFPAVFPTNVRASRIASGIRSQAAAWFYLNALPA
jgi:hypothetical protein